MKRLFVLVVAATVLLLGCDGEKPEYVEMASCSECGEECTAESLIYSSAYGHICAQCFTDREFFVCIDCRAAYVQDSPDTRCGYCYDCSDRHTWWCSECEEPYLVESMAELEPGQFLCGACLAAKLRDADALDGIDADFDKFYPWPGSEPPQGEE